MKPKNKPKFIVLTTNNIAIAEFKNKKSLTQWAKQYQDSFRPIVKIISGPDINAINYLPIF